MTDLPLTIDVGPIKYYLGNGPSVEFLYNNRNEFLKAFNIKNEDTETERILRTYMSSAKPNFKNNDKEKLIQILQNRVNILKNSIEVSPSYLKNVKFKRSYTEIQKIIDKLKGLHNEVNEVNESFVNTDKKYDIKYKLILKLSWMLMNKENSWEKFIKNLDNITLKDVINFDNEPDINNDTRENMKKYIENLTMIFHIKNFLNTSEDKSEDKSEELNEKFKAFEMKSKETLFNYIKQEYDPVYSFLVETINNYNKDIDINKLLDIYKKMNSIYKTKKYGIHNVSNDLDFINYMLVSINDKFNKDNKMQNFYEKIQTLPRINELSTSNELNDIFLSSLIELDDTDFFNKNSLYIIYPNDSENITLYGKKETQININEIEPYINKLLMNGHLFTGSLLTLIIFIVYNKLDK